MATPTETRDAHEIDAGLDLMRTAKFASISLGLLIFTLYIIISKYSTPELDTITDMVMSVAQAVGAITSVIFFRRALICGLRSIHSKIDGAKIPFE